MKKIGYGDLQFGDVINSTPGPIGWYNLLWRLASSEVRRYQREEFGSGAPGVDDVHTRFVCQPEYPVIWEVTSPKTRFAVFKPEKGTTYNVYRFYRPIPKGEESVFWTVMCSMDGIKYDYGQLVDIKIKQWLDWIFKSSGEETVIDRLSIFDLGRRRKVCSVGVHLLFLAWWKEYGKSQGIKRPLGDNYVERTCPALFANHETFIHLGELV